MEGEEPGEPGVSPASAAALRLLFCSEAALAPFDFLFVPPLPLPAPAPSVAPTDSVSPTVPGPVGVFFRRSVLTTARLAFALCILGLGQRRSVADSSSSSLAALGAVVSPGMSLPFLPPPRRTAASGTGDSAPRVRRVVRMSEAKENGTTQGVTVAARLAGSRAEALHGRRTGSALAWELLLGDAAANAALAAFDALLASKRACVAAGRNSDDTLQLRRARDQHTELPTIMPYRMRCRLCCHDDLFFLQGAAGMTRERKAWRRQCLKQSCMEPIASFGVESCSTCGLTLSCLSPGVAGRRWKWQQLPRRGDCV